MRQYAHLLPTTVCDANVDPNRYEFVLQSFFAEVDNEWIGLYVMRNQFIARDECEYYPANLHRYSARNNTGQFDVVDANWSGDQGNKQSSNRYKYKLKATCIVVRGRHHEFQ